MAKGEPLRVGLMAVRHFSHETIRCEHYQSPASRHEMLELRILCRGRPIGLEEKKQDYSIVRTDGSLTVISQWGGLVEHLIRLVTKELVAMSF